MALSRHVRREELFPEQLQQQEVAIQTQQLQDQLQDLTIQWQQNPEDQELFLQQQRRLLQRLQDSQKLQQELQNRLQLRLRNVPLAEFTIPRTTTEILIIETSTTERYVGVGEVVFEFFVVRLLKIVVSLASKLYVYHGDINSSDFRSEF